VPVRNTRRRYLAFRVLCSRRVSEEQLWSTVVSGFRLLYGVKGLSEANLKLIEYEPEASTGILRCSHDHVTQTRATLARVAELFGQPAVVQVDRVSGTIKSLRSKSGS
jgi:RNase P/RNase MRP subunit POP5